MPAWPGVVLAPAAARWLANTSAARILNVFDRACNLINQDQEVLALVASRRGLTPFALVVDADSEAPFRGLPADSSVRVAAAERRLVLGPLRIDYGAAVLWEARPDWPVVRGLYANGGAAAAQLAAIAAEVEVAGSLLEMYRPAAGGTALGQALLASARPGAKALVSGLAARDEAQAAAGAWALAGLGGGLTPAGDDFILGALLAAWAGLYGDGAEALGLPVVAAATPRTTTLSGAYLTAAAGGECMAHWHTLFAAQLQHDERATQAALEALVSIGHTSGADALAGFLALHYASGQGG